MSYVIANRDLPDFRYNIMDMNLEQVARRAKVSTATVSRVLNNVSVVKTSTRARVLKAIEELKYHPNLHARNLAGGTTLGEFIDLAAACRLYLTNDSGAMHVACALGVPTVAVFGATDDVTTGPTGPLARVVREHAECSPCLLRNCPIDHRCMTRVTPERVAAVSLELLSTAETWTHEAKS